LRSQEGSGWIIIDKPKISNTNYNVKISFNKADITALLKSITDTKKLKNLTEEVKNMSNLEEVTIGDTVIVKLNPTPDLRKRKGDYEAFLSRKLGIYRG